MSSDFWIKLTLALLLLGMGIGLVHQLKFGSIRRLRANWLRQSILATLKELVNEIPLLMQTNAAPGYVVYRLRANLEQDYQRSEVLFEEERTVLAAFLSGISNLIARADTGVATTQDLEKVVLLGHRAILEISEIGA